MFRQALRRCGVNGVGKGVRRSEWSWVLLWMALALLAANGPYLLGALLSTPEMQFGGIARRQMHQEEDRRQ